MSLPESMSRIVIVGTKSHMDEAIDALFSVGAVHLIDHTVDADEGFTLGTSRPYAAKASERLLKVRAMEKDLGITKRTPTTPISESEIKSKISSNSVELVEDEVISVLDKKNDLNQRITELNATKKSLEQLSKLDIDLDLYSGYKSIFSTVGTVTSDPASALADIPCEIYNSGISKKEGGVVAVFAKKEDREKVLSALSDCEFSEISVPDETGKPSAALAKTEHDLAATQAELAKVDEELNKLLEKHKDFLKASEEELAIEAQKGEIPVRIASSDYTFVIDGWVPTKKAEAVKIDIEAKVEGTYVEIQETRGRTMKEVEEAEDRFKEVPTKFDNGRIVKEFQYPTKLMSVPKYQEIDPSILIAIFLPLFFGMMIGDVGYAIPFIILGAYGLKVTHHKDWRAIATVLFFGGIWAFIFGLFFYGECLGMHFIGENTGVEYTWEALLGLHNLPDLFQGILPSVVLDNGEVEYGGVHKLGADWIGFQLKLSVYIGICHLLLAYCCAVYNKTLQHGFVHAFKEKGGWVLSFIGMVLICYALAMILIEGQAFDAVLIPLAIGAVLLVIGIILNLPEEGMQAVMELPGIVGGILSYTRIAAIGMSKAGMALAFNYICIGMIYGGLGEGPIALVVAFALFAFLHLMIWTLGILSAGLHSLRLQFVELMVKFFDGGGVEYEPLKIKRVKTTSSKDKA